MENNSNENNTLYHQVYDNQPGGYNYSQEPVPVGKWVAIHFIKWIPVAGGIVYLVMLFIWAFGRDSQDETFRNWAKAELIVCAVTTVIWIILIAAFGAFFMNLVSNAGNAMDLGPIINQ